MNQVGCMDLALIRSTMLYLSRKHSPLRKLVLLVLLAGLVICVAAPHDVPPA